MNAMEIDHVSAGYVFAYDGETGEVLWTHEKIVEVVRGGEACPLRMTEMECEQVKDEAAQVFQNRKIEALIAPEGFALGEDDRVWVDPKKKILKALKEDAPSFVERFAKGNR